MKWAGFSTQELRAAGFTTRAISPRICGAGSATTAGEGLAKRPHSGSSDPVELAADAAKAASQQSSGGMHAWQQKIEAQLIKARQTIEQQSAEIARLKHRMPPSLPGDATMSVDPEPLPSEATAGHGSGADEAASAEPSELQAALARVRAKKLYEEQQAASVKAEQDAAAARIQSKYRRDKKVISERPARYAGVHGLIASIESAAVAPLRGRFVLELYRRGGRIERRQDLPAAAFWTADELTELHTKLKQCPGLNAKQAERRFLSVFHAFSAPWTTPDHCDPSREHLAALAHVVEARLRTDGKDSYGDSNTLHSQVFQPVGMSEEETDVALFWSYSCLFQPRSALHDDRTAAQKQSHDDGLNATDIWFGHERTSVLMPMDPPASRDGWCACHKWMSALYKVDAAARLDLSKRHHADVKAAHTDMSCRMPQPSGEYSDLKRKCDTRRMPPMAPDTVACLLDASAPTKLTFAREADREVAFKLYQKLFATVAPTVRELCLSSKALRFERGDGWRTAEFRTLAAALPAFTACKLLDFERHEMSNDACKAVLDALADKSSMPALETLKLNFCKIGDRAGEALALALRSRGKTALKLIDLNSNALLRSDTIKMDIRFAAGKAGVQVLGVEYEAGFGSSGTGGIKF